MKVLQGQSWREKLPMNGQSTDILDGALVAWGEVYTESAALTAGTIGLCAASAVDAVGIKLGDHDFSEVGDSTPETGATEITGGVELVIPGTILSAEYDLSTGLIDVASASGAAITISGIEDNINGGWLLATAGPGVGHLGFIITSSSTVATLASAPATAFTSATDVIKILAPGHTLAFLSTDRTKFSSQAAAGTATVRVLYNEFDANGNGGWQRLEPPKQDGTIVKLNAAADGLGAGVKFRCVFALQGTSFTPTN